MRTQVAGKYVVGLYEDLVDKRRSSGMDLLILVGVIRHHTRQGDLAVEALREVLVGLKWQRQLSRLSTGGTKL